MKKKILIGLSWLLIVSLTLTGCQSETKPQEAVSKSTQTIEESTIGQPEQMVDDLKMTVEGAPVEVRLASDEKCRYEYDQDKYTITTSSNDTTFEIKVTEIQSGAAIDDQSHVIIYIPNQAYTSITCVSEGSSLTLPVINTNMTVTSTASSVMFSLPSDYNQTFHYTAEASFCLLAMNGIDDYAINAKLSTSSMQVPSSWPAYDMLRSDYRYTSGNGTANINIDITNSSFVFN